MSLSNLDQFLTIPAVPTIPSSLPPSGPAGGDLAGTYPNPTLAVIGSATGPIGDGTHVSTVTIDANGRVTALTSTAITFPSAGNLTGPITSVGLATSIASQTGTGTTFAMSASPTFTGTVTLPAVSIGDGSNVALGSTTGTQIGTATTQKLGFFGATPIVQPTGNIVTALQNLGLGASLTVTATTNANLTGPITSVGNTTSIASQTGTGSKFVVDNAPTIQLPFIVDTSDNTKKIGFTLSGATTSTTLTIVSSQTASRNLTVPVLGGNDTIATLSASNVFAGNNSFSGNVGARFTGTATAQQGTTGAVSIYRVNGTLQPIGSLILQSDVNQSTGGVALYVGTTPTVGATFFTSAASVGTIASTYTGVVLAGVQTSLAAVAGQVGEVLTGTPQTTYTNFTTTATFQAMTGTLALTPGDWLITATVTFSSNGATLGNSAQFGLSATAAGTGLTGSSPLNTEGLSITYIPVGLFTTLSVFQTETMSIRYQVSAATNVFFIGKASFSVGNPQYAASITATRMR